jgi:DNA gyrase subunit A
MATANGTVKKTPLRGFSRPRASGIIAVELRDDDQLVGVDLTDGTRDIMMFTTNGKVIRFRETDVRPMGRTACGVRGIKLAAGHKVNTLIIAEDEGCVLTATENGFGKRTPIEQYATQGRGGQGVISVQTTARNGDVVGSVLVKDDHETMMITNAGTLVRTRVTEISIMGRNTQGVRLINLSNEERLVGIERIVEPEGIDESEQDNSAE